MGLTVIPQQGTVRINDQPIAGQTISWSAGDFVSVDVGGVAVIEDNHVRAATISGAQGTTPPSMQTYSPPTQSTYQIYYNRSYRWQLSCPGGSIGIRI